LQRLATEAVRSEKERPQIPGLKVARKQHVIVLALVASDVVLALVVWEAARLLQATWGRGPLTEVALFAIVPSILIWVGLRALLGLYPGYGLDPPEELRRQTYAVLATLAATATFAIAFRVGDSMSRLLLVSSFLGLLLLAPLARHFVKRALMRTGLWGKPVMVMGSGETGAQVVRLLKEERDLGLNPVAVFDNRLVPAGGVLEGVPYGGDLTSGMRLGKEHRVDTAIFAMPHIRRKHLARFVGWASLTFAQVVVIPNLGGVTNSAVTARNLAGTLGVEIRYNLLNPWALRGKRLLDLTATAVGGVLILPLILVLCVLVWLESGGSAFYRAERMGRDGALFSCVKFRTMVDGAEDMLEKILEENPGMREEYVRFHKLRDDPRVTRVGRFLRKTSLDELPQLWNVLKGEMSLVGPRPYLPRESADIGVTQSEILRVPPGITGPWQVAGRNHTSFGERVQMDVHYVHDWSVWLDLVLLARTVRTVFKGGAY
jgi:Undecaprenyl-phosphate galactose phosphotransferase WbaP